jgi:hypothetical protein
VTAQWDLITRTEVTGSASVVTFSSIGSYQAYRVIATTLDSSGSDYLAMRLNGNTSNMYSVGYFANSTGGAVVANGFTTYNSVGINAGTNAPGTANSNALNVIDIGFANSTTLAKPAIALGGWARNMLRASGVIYNSSSATTSISLAVGLPFSTLTVNTVVTLYGRNIA